MAERQEGMTEEEFPVKLDTFPQNLTEADIRTLAGLMKAHPTWQKALDVDTKFAAQLLIVVHAMTKALDQLAEQVLDEAMSE